MKTNIKQSLIAVTAILAFSFFAGCTGGGGGDSSTSSDGTITTSDGTVVPLVTPEGSDDGSDDGVGVEGSALFCDSAPAAKVDNPEELAALVADLPIKRMNVSKDALNHQEQVNAQNTLARMSVVVPFTSADGNVTDDPNNKVHPIAVSYAEQVYVNTAYSDIYEMGDGSADIGDPYHIDDIFVSLSLDNGKTYKKVNVSGTAMRGDQPNSSIKVNWTADKTAAPNTDYPGHSHKPKMAVNGNQILVAWHDKFCPSGDPFGLYVKDENGSATDELVSADQPDYFKVNGAQGSINYELDGSVDPKSSTGELLLAPNGKEVYEVPFSCVWTARGVLNTEDENNVSVTWYKAEQLTTGTRDANKVWIASAKGVGFALAWQEDPEGLRQGQGAGPGEGWSGATTNHGADIWYTYIAEDKFAAIDETFVEPEDADAEDLTKPKALNNFAYPTRITDNEVCIEGDTKLYCQEIACIDYVNSKDADITEEEEGTKDGSNSSAKCVTNVQDPLWIEPTPIILDGDTGASRPAMSILKTDTGMPTVILAYEETKGLSESNSESQDQGETETEIEYEGKVVYFNSFPFDQPVSINAGTIVNPRAPDAVTGEPIFENARRVVIVNQVDACDEADYTFGLMYKQGVETRGGSSDMFIRMNTSFYADTFVAEDQIPNLSSMPDFNKTAILESDTPDAMPEDFWTPANLEDETYTNLYENTFSPRGLMRGNDIFIGFEYTPNWAQTEKGNEPNTFYIHRYADDNDGEGRVWQGPKQISKVVGRKVSTLDPRFITTPKGSYETTGLESDKSNPDVFTISYGTFDMESGLELDLFYSRSTDGGRTWSTVDLNVTEDGVETTKVANAKLAGIKGLEEKEVQAILSPDGTMLFHVWIQEEEEASYYDDTTHLEDENLNIVDHFGGLDSWFGRVDFNATAEEPVE